MQCKQKKNTAIETKHKQNEKDSAEAVYDNNQDDKKYLADQGVEVIAE